MYGHHLNKLLLFLSHCLLLGRKQIAKIAPMKGAAGCQKVGCHIKWHWGLIPFMITCYCLAETSMWQASTVSQIWFKTLISIENQCILTESNAFVKWIYKAWDFILFTTSRDIEVMHSVSWLINGPFYFLLVLIILPDFSSDVLLPLIIPSFVFCIYRE